MAKAFTWDHVAFELTEIEAEIPDGCTPKQALILLDAAFAESCGNGAQGTYGRQFRQQGDVFVMDAKFGRDQECHFYWCPVGDPKKAEKLAKKELAFDED